MDKNKIIEFQLMEQQIQQMDNNMQNIEQNIKDIDSILKTLDDFSKLKKGDKLMVPVANGIFAESTLTGTGKLKVNVGSNIVVDKDVEETKKMMSEQVVELENYKAETVHYYDQMYQKMQLLQAEMVKEQAKEENQKSKISELRNEKISEKEKK